jgi:hypothetical protein
MDMVQRSVMDKSIGHVYSGTTQTTRRRPFYCNHMFAVLERA